MEKVLFYKNHPDAIIPKLAEEGSAGFDLHAIEDFYLYPGMRVVVGTGLVVQPPEGYHTEILIRSSMAYKHSIVLINGVGLIDRSYAGPDDELKIMLYRLPIDQANSDHSLHWFEVAGGPVAAFKKGDRIAQLVFRKTELFKPWEVLEAPAGNRGGLGSTGK